MCRRCNELGHFAEVHDVADASLRERIASILGATFFAAKVEHRKRSSTEAPVTLEPMFMENLNRKRKKNPLEFGPAGPPGKEAAFSDWYAA